MANAIYCFDNNTEDIDFGGQTIPQGSFITATNAQPDPTVINYCFEITDGNSAAGSFTASTETFTSCYECLVNNYTIVSLESCDSRTIFNVDISNFSEVPILEQSYFIRATDRYDTYIGCFKILEISQFSLADYTALNLLSVEFLSTASFPDCDTCLNGFSAGTDYTTCQVCCPCESGSTITEVITPHPTWTNGFGQSVVQLNAVTLGGPNGLNS